MDAVNLEAVSPNSCFPQKKDVGLVKMLPGFSITHGKEKG